MRRDLSAPSTTRYLGDHTDDVRISHRARLPSEDEAHLRLGGFAPAPAVSIVDRELEDASSSLLRASPLESYDTLGEEQILKFGF